jgi:hypothetical protein
MSAKSSGKTNPIKRQFFYHAYQPLHPSQDVSFGGLGHSDELTTEVSELIIVVIEEVLR